MAWSDEAIETLKRMWGAGATGNEIAAAIPGCAGRSAVVGKAHRLGLSARGSPVTRKPPSDRDASMQRVLDLVIEAPYPTLNEAARTVGVSGDLARRWWRMTVEATHGGDPK